ncbi:MAG: nucleotide exchange factor GrpE [Lachnospiraceae bacterium]|nr:nucleotide exchange factor GrpE [Lachnospiraceae bacterium]
MAVEEKELDEQIKEEVNSSDADVQPTDSEAPNPGTADSGESTATEAEESGESGDNAGSDNKKEKKKSFLGKDKKEKANKLQEKVDELEDRVKRQMAEFDNFRKRSEKEKSAMFETGAKSVVEKILPVVDNFERGLAGLSEEEIKQPFAEGMNMVYKQLMTELEKLDVKPIEAVGCEFNPELHNAVMQVESEEYESGIIAQELQKGYTYRGSVVRHSMVAVVI